MFPRKTCNNDLPPSSKCMCLRSPEEIALLGGIGRSHRGGGWRVCARYHTWPWPYGHGPSPLYNAGTEHVGFSPTRQILLTPRAKCREVFGEGKLHPTKNRLLGGV